MSSWTRRASSLPLPASHTRAVLSSDAVTNAASKMFDGNVCAASGSALSPIGSPGAAHNYLILLAVPTGAPEVSKINYLRNSGKANRSRAFRGVPRVSFPPIGSPVARTRDPTVKPIGETAAVLQAPAAKALHHHRPAQRELHPVGAVPHHYRAAVFQYRHQGLRIGTGAPRYEALR
jgi:hypothetical protein